jgi:ribosomal protein S12 methylthiotransferase accessory factor
LQDDAEEDPRFYAHAEKMLRDMEVGYHKDLLKDIEQVITILKSHGYEWLIAVELTLPEIGIPTVRIIVPGMEAFYFNKTRRGARLFRSQD